MRLLRFSVLRREKTRAYEIFEPTRPGLVRVAAYIHAHRDQGLSRCHDSDVKIDVKQVGNLLHGARDRKLGADLLCEIGVAAATCLKVRLVCLSLHRPNVDNFKLARSCYEQAQLITEPRQACCFIGSRGPFVAPSRLVSINSKSKMATRRTCACADSGHATRAQKIPKSPMRICAIRAS
jgi:hypothetical protein